jgi:hypothetical protein
VKTMNLDLKYGQGENRARSENVNQLYR